MLGDHWLLGKSGFFPEAFHVPLIVRHPAGVRGGVVDRFTEHVDLLPTLLEALGLGIPLQCDGRSLVPFLRGEPPLDWRSAVHWEHDFRDVETPTFEMALGLASADCGIMVHADGRHAYVHFSGLPALCFDAGPDPHWTHNLAGETASAPLVRDLAQALLTWRMSIAERRLCECKLTPEGVIGRYDPLPEAIAASSWA